ncbi:hypothetical protein ANN_04489 [Periplaneta americana]|uniref:Uncharacterized protein n=1 Tax=Periplaneta americana TaxID=6978 RepID=A0ABQ8T9X1_PERAM|nr:hypothetical protein ANN_04489 [Periplaneta americana]
MWGAVIRARRHIRTESVPCISHEEGPHVDYHDSSYRSSVQLIPAMQLEFPSTRRQGRILQSPSQWASLPLRGKQSEREVDNPHPSNALLLPFRARVVFGNERIAPCHDILNHAHPRYKLRYEAHAYDLMSNTDFRNRPNIQRTVRHLNKILEQYNTNISTEKTRSMDFQDKITEETIKFRIFSM